MGGIWLLLVIFIIDCVLLIAKAKRRSFLLHSCVALIYLLLVGLTNFMDSHQAAILLYVIVLFAYIHFISLLIYGITLMLKK